MFINNGQYPSFEKRIWLSSPTMHGEELEYIKEAYATNWMSTVGKNIAEAEHRIAKKVGCKYAVALSCGTAALHLAMRLAGVKPGERVFCSDMTFVATVNPVMFEGGEPVFIDTEYDTWNMSPEALERAFDLYPDVRVVVIVHLYGTPAKIDELREVCDRHGAIIIEDAAESLGADYRGNTTGGEWVQTGSFGTYNCISFNGNKIITGSVGGMLLTDDADAAIKTRKWSTHSRDDAAWYQHEEIGYNYRMSNIVAGVICGQFGHLDEHIAQKRAIYERYRVGFADLPVSMNPFDAKKSHPNYWLSCLLIDKDAMCGQTRYGCDAVFMPEHGKSCPTEIFESLLRHNAEGRPIWKPMHLQPMYLNNGFVNASGDAGTDVGADIFDRGLCLPSDNKMTPDEQAGIINIVRACFE